MENLAREVLRIARSLMSVSIGDTIETDNVRIHRFRPSIRVWDLTNAGKRGKTVDYFWATNFDMIPQPHSEIDVERFMRSLDLVKDYETAVKRLKLFIEFVNSQVTARLEYGEERERGVDIPPAGFKPIKVNGKKVQIEADYSNFVVRDLEDQNNLPTCIPSAKGGKKDVKVFFRWVSDNQSKIKNMSFSDVMDGMQKNGINYHHYCAMD